MTTPHGQRGLLMQKQKQKVLNPGTNEDFSDTFFLSLHVINTHSICANAAKQLVSSCTNDWAGHEHITQ